MDAALLADEAGAGIDFGRLRRQRRERLLAAMADHGLEVLVFGRPANVHYATGARQLWTSGARPFAPACVVVRDAGEIHLLSTWDTGVPQDIPRKNLFGLSWDPTTLMNRIGAVSGLRSASCIGTDALTPRFAELLAKVAPRAAVVDANPALRQARESKTADEVRCVAVAVAVAESVMTAMIEALRRGITERQLLAVAAARSAGIGVPILASDAVAFVSRARDPGHPNRLPTDRELGAGELMVLNPGVLYCGYEGGLGRTWTLGSVSADPVRGALADRTSAALSQVVAQCRAGQTGADLLGAWARTGERFPPVPIAYGIGLGAEPPVIAEHRGADAVLRVGSVLAIQSWVVDDRTGGCFERELVLVCDHGPEILTRYGHDAARS